MKKFRCKESNKIVTFGDKIAVIKEWKDYNSVYSCTEYITLSEYTLPYFLSNGIIEEVEAISTDIEYYIDKLSKKLNLSKSATTGLINCFTEYSPSIVFSMLLKEIALEMDYQYKDHITDSDELYVVSFVDGSIVSLDKSKVRTYKNFSAFRSIEDAKTACKILRPIMKKMYSKSGK